MPAGLAVITVSILSPTYVLGIWKRLMDLESIDEIEPVFHLPIYSN